MRIGCLQFSPQVGDVYNNLNRADAVLNKASVQDAEGLDLLVLPELAFTGYNFRSLAEITPYLEPSGSGISALWARTTALKLNCNVVVGYPEKVDVTQKWPASPEFYNSAIIVNRDGETIANYRKSFLYAIDETWALEGRDGFFEGYIPDLGDVAMGICMDLNPYRFEAPWHDFEFAFHVLEVEANVVILTMAWLTREGAHTFSQQPQEPDLQTLEYWVQRLEPIIRKESEEEIIVVFCNRCGTERDAVYAGTSSVIGIKNGEINLYGILGRGVKELLVIDTDKAPFARLLQTEQNRKALAGKNDGQSSVQSVAGSSPGSATFSSKRSFFPFRDMARSGGLDDESIGTPIDDIDDAWEIKSNTSSLGSGPSSYSQYGSMPPRSTLPKLGLLIPTTPEDTLHPSQTKGPVSATRAHDGKSPAVGPDDIPTPTAPSPTPISVRPHFNLPDKGTTMSLLPHIGLPDRRPPVPTKGDVIPSSVNMKAGGGAVKVNRADTPITPPWITGTKGKAGRSTPISEAPPSPPSDEEAGTENSTPNLSTGKNSPKPKGDDKKGAKLKGAYDKGRGGTKSNLRPRASSLKTEVGPVRSLPSAAMSATVGLDTATPTTTTTTLDSIWGDALKQLISGKSNIAEDSMYRHDQMDDIIVREPSSNPDVQDQLFVEVQQSFGRPVSPINKGPLADLNAQHVHPSTEMKQTAAPNVDVDDRQASPAPTSIPMRPPSTKSRNASLSRAPQAADSSNVRRSMSLSRMSIPIMASPSVFSQEVQSQSQPRRVESPIFFRPDSKISSKPANEGSTPSNAASGTGVWMKPANRPVSRGRQPPSMPNATKGNATQSTQWSNGHASRSNASVDRGRRTSINRATESTSRPNAPSALSSRDPRDQSTSSSSASMLFGTPLQTRTQPPLDPDDEIIAMISLIHDDCPVHNSRAPSLEPQSLRQPQTEQQHQASAEQQTSPAAQQAEQQPQQRQPTPMAQTPAQQQQQASQTAASQGSRAEPVYEIILPPHIRELVESMSSPDYRTQSPLRALDLQRPARSTPKFDPPTPTAMQFGINDNQGRPSST